MFYNFQFWHALEDLRDVALTCTTSDARVKTRNIGLTKTEILASIPPPGDVDGENGYFLASPSVVEYFDYWVGQTFRYVHRCRWNCCA